MPDDVGVGDAAVLALDRPVGRPRVETAEQRLARRVLHDPFRRADIAVAVGDLPAVDEERVDHAVASEPVVMAPGLELRVGAVAVEGAPESGGKFARDVERVVVLAAHRREIAGEKRVDRKWRVHGRGLLSHRERVRLLRNSFSAVFAQIGTGTAAGQERRGFLDAASFVTLVHRRRQCKGGNWARPDRKSAPSGSAAWAYRISTAPRTARERRQNPRRPRRRRDADRHRRFYGSGHNEMLIAEALKERRREDCVLSVKFGALRRGDDLRRL